MSTRFTRRDLARGMVAGAVAVALTPRVRAQVGAPAGKIALRYNENPYGPSRRAREAAYEAVDQGAYYAGPISDNLLQIIAERHGLARENMVLSSGSNEALQAAFVAWGRKGRIIQPELTYTDHVDFSRRMGVDIGTVPMKDDLSIDLDAVAAAVDDGVSLVYICNPNNPTGRILDGDTLRDFCRSVGRRATVVVDEAYNEITDDPGYSSMVDLVRAGENVIVLRTFSKIFGMAGMRVGYGMARPEHAAQIAGYVGAWPNVAGLAAAKACYTDDDFIGYSREKIIAGRQIVNETFRACGIEPLPSQANFVFADIGRDAAEFQRLMAARDVLVRGGWSPSQYLRVSMGRLEDVEVFRRVFTEVYNA